jgi:integrase
MAKRGYGSGSIRKRGQTWEIIYRPLPGAKQVCKKVGRESDGITRADAEHALNEVLVEIGRGHGKAHMGHRFSLVAKQWREQVEALNPELSNRSLELYDNALNVHLLPSFADDPLHQIDAPVIERYIAKKLTLAPSDPEAVPVEGNIANNLSEPIGPRSIQQQMSVLNNIFRFALRHKLITVNPMTEIEVKLTTKKKPVKVLEQEDVKKLLINARDEEQETLLLILGATGLRLGEALALRVGDFDPATQTLSILRTQTKKGGKTVVSENGPKTNAGRRTLRVSDELAKRIKRQIDRAVPRCKNNEIKLLFPNKKGNMHSESNFRNRIFRPALERAGLPLTYTPHSLRHTFASECIAAGLPDTQIAYFLGHSNPQTTRQIYAHVFERHRQTIADLSGIYSHEQADVNLEA